ncbi:DNA/RNA helicase domain-containing protein [Plantactinospora sp. WMMB782]|uniref:DNA/RNA helicase domain-containing protein n=1 Tax=Plantactinospora sp. WMMB782 TaxID=3404121 RepID=UPI003B933498
MTARISAGFCWEWTRRPQQGRLVPDVRIGSWHRPWNAHDDHLPRNVPAGSYWATDPRGFEQIGCIYTAQGFEYEWSGVILGEDLVVRDGRFISQPSRSKDVAIIGTSDRPRIARNADRLIRNAYKVLLTRGLRGCLIYSVDEETQDFLRSLVPSALDTMPQEAPGVYSATSRRRGHQSRTAESRTLQPSEPAELD